MCKAAAIRSLLFSLVWLVFSRGSFGQIAISVSFGPPALPVYEQPICPEEGYIWTPGFWAYDDDDGYYWVPGTWVLAPEPGLLWTPGYWGWSDEGVFVFHEGYWGEHVGFYGGINYGYGYFGHGYDGGRWDNGHFYYNTYVNHVNTTIIHNTYNTTIVENNTTRVSYSGGSGGVQARPTPEEEAFSRERHVAPLATQTQHIQQARANPELRASQNHGKPPIAATAKPADFKSGVVPAKQAGGAYTAPPANTARKSAETRTGNEARSNTTGHASDLQPHHPTPPNTGNAATDKRYQKQQDQLAAKQNQEHQKLQQQQEKEHQKAEKKAMNDAQKQQLEQRHMQQTQQLEQKHAAQQEKLQQHQQPKPSAPKPEEKRPPEKRPQ
jgi:WXXGXW repeat (2 copies)